MVNEVESNGCKRGLWKTEVETNVQNLIFYSYLATYDQLLQPENAPMRAAFIGAGGLLGYMMGAIRGRLDGARARSGWECKYCLDREPRGAVTYDVHPQK